MKDREASVLTIVADSKKQSIV